MSIIAYPFLIKCCHLDDQTWNDLHLDDIYAQADRTQTSCGQVLLYNILRKPIIDYLRWEQRKRQYMPSTVILPSGRNCS